MAIGYTGLTMKGRDLPENIDALEATAFACILSIGNTKRRANSSQVVSPSKRKEGTACEMVVEVEFLVL